LSQPSNKFVYVFDEERFLLFERTV
jgi:hypothetical protein